MLLLTAICPCTVGLVPPKKDGASEPTLSLPPGEELKTVMEKDGNILDNFVLKIKFHNGTLR